jgi:hypothetical protein
LNDGVLLAVWSGPRNISTAMMRAWDNRPDCSVVDEPLYAYYLAESGLDHPGREEVIAAGETSWQPVVADLTTARPGIYYQKHMAQHLLPQLPREWIGLLSNVLLIRDPADVVASYVRKRPQIDDADIGVLQQVEIFDQLSGGVPVIDASDFLGDPRGHLAWLCAHIGVEFTDAMLAWPSGPRETDGVWAPHWYAEVVASTGFVPYRRKRSEELSSAARQIIERLRAPYERLHAARLVL